MTRTYSETQVQGVLTLLDQLHVRGLNNMRAVVMIEQILNSPSGEEKEKDGNCSQEE